MKSLKNNSENYLTFVKSGEPTLDISGVIFRQLGSSIEYSLPALEIFGDCFITTISVALSYNELKNANYIIRVVDSAGNTILTSNAIVSDNDGQDNYIIIDDDNLLDNIGDLPIQLLFNTFDYTFDYTFD